MPIPPLPKGRGFLGSFADPTWQGGFNIIARGRGDQRSFSAWCTQSHLGLYLPPSINTYIHAIFFADAHSFSPLQRFLWARVVYNLGQWQVEAPRYSAHALLAARVRHLQHNQPPAATLLLMDRAIPAL